jgi:hypothetical protein
MLKQWSGNGIKTTEPFSIPNKPWSIKWSSNPVILNGQSAGMLQIMVYDTKNPNLPVTLAANTNVQSSDTSYVYQSGEFYLTINAANTDWKVEVWANPSPAPTPALTPAPTPTPTPAPTPSPGYSRSTPVGTGIALTTKVNLTGAAAGIIGGEYEVRLTLLEVIRGTEAWQRIYARNQFNDPPKPGFEYILAKVRFEYLTGATPDTSYRISSVWFDAVSMGGKDYDGVSVVEPDPAIGATLYPGASQEGWIVFLVAQGDTGPLMTLGRESDGTGGIWFKLY